jgi:Transposase DDE domain
VVPGWEYTGVEFAKKFERKMSEAFSCDELDSVARETGFKVRESKLTPVMFLDTVLFKETDSAAISLEDHCIALKQRYDVDIRKQSLAERFDESATLFIQALLHRQLSSQIATDIQNENLSKELRHFTSVKIKDSTRFQVPECLKEHYPGSTGAASGAGVHIQFEFDLLAGASNVVTVTDALEQDVNDAIQTQGDIEQGSLIIRDLGYFSTSVLEEAHQHGAYYITRARHRMIYHHADIGKEINFNSVYNKMKKCKLSHMELPISIGDKKMRNRLIIEMLPKSEVEKRIAKAGKEARKKGRQLSREYRSRARLNLFITNVPVKWISTEKVRTIYRLRWQIELRFKAWKSFYHIDAVKKMQRYRFECYLYATLLLLMINLEIATNYSAALLKHTAKPLSILKFYKTTSQSIATLREALLACGDKLLKYLAVLYEISHKKLLTEKRKGHTAPLAQILLESLA